MKKFLLIVFENAPWLEVLSRILYWRFAFIHKLLNQRKQKKGPANCLHNQNSSVPLELLQEEVMRHGIKSGDILIVHSSMQSLSVTSSSPSQIIEMLRRVIGENGTLVMPAIPKYREATSGTGRVTQDLSNSIWTYNVQLTPPWTGALPLALMRTPGAIRSRFPLNTVVAIGRHSQLMIDKELVVPDSTPCGPNSAWAYCANNNAKILMLGVDLAHSLTMIHVAEDCHDGSWPISNWYRRRTFLVRDRDFEDTVTVRERHPKWSIFYAERKLNKDLFDANIAKKTKLGSIDIISLSSDQLLSFLEARRNKAYPYYLWKIFT
jgi:aminoglycoside 3-N-acetyltransferase